MYKYDFSYRRLNVYQCSMTLVKEVYSLLKLYPQHEQYAICDQMMCQLEISHDLTYITQEQFNSLEEKVFTIFKMLSSMQTSLRSRIQNA